MQIVDVPNERYCTQYKPNFHYDQLKNSDRLSISLSQNLFESLIIIAENST